MTGGEIVWLIALGAMALGAGANQLATYTTKESSETNKKDESIKPKGFDELLVHIQKLLDRYEFDIGETEYTSMGYTKSFQLGKTNYKFTVCLDFRTSNKPMGFQTIRIDRDGEDVYNHSHLRDYEFEKVIMEKLIKTFETRDALRIQKIIEEDMITYLKENDTGEWAEFRKDLKDLEKARAVVIRITDKYKEKLITLHQDVGSTTTTKT